MSLFCFFSTRSDICPGVALPECLCRGWPVPLSIPRLSLISDMAGAVGGGVQRVADTRNAPGQRPLRPPAGPRDPEVLADCGQSVPRSIPNATNPRTLIRERTCLAGLWKGPA